MSISPPDTLPPVEDLDGGGDIDGEGVEDGGCSEELAKEDPGLALGLTREGGGGDQLECVGIGLAEEEDDLGVKALKFGEEVVEDDCITLVMVELIVIEELTMLVASTGVLKNPEEDAGTEETSELIIRYPMRIISNLIQEIDLPRCDSTSLR